MKILELDCYWGAIVLFATLIDVYLINFPFGILTGSSAMIFYAIGNYAKNNRINKNVGLVVFYAWIIAIMFSHLNMGSCYYQFIL